MKLSQKEKILLYSGIGIVVVGGIYLYVKSNSTSAASSTSPTSSPACSGGAIGATQPNYTCELAVPIVTPVISPAVTTVAAQAPSIKNIISVTPPELKAEPKLNIAKSIGDVSNKILSFILPAPAPVSNSRKFKIPHKIKL